jgi:hypothetical protein
MPDPVLSVTKKAYIGWQSPAGPRPKRKKEKEVQDPI